MKAYKGFDRNMRCRGFQFEEGKTYEEDKAELCKTGFHACTNPLDVWRYYSPADECEYHEVELEDVSEERNSGDSKVCGKRIRIGAKLGIEELVNASVRIYDEEVKEVKNAKGALTDNGAISTQIASAEGWACIGSTGYRACIGAAGDWACIASAGEWACIASAGDWACIASTGYRAHIASAGDWARIASTRYRAQIASAGYEAQIETLGTNCVMMCAGQNSRAKGKIGSWIVLTEWIGEVPNVVAKRIDGALVKADTWYVLRDGQLQEVGTDE